ncbi:MAG: ExeM/NucH family extracellular endonuclease [Anaerolineales bacterium]|nr:ExeM/NucH family extracellular endonuclease [Anaerolineales bacterium]
MRHPPFTARPSTVCGRDRPARFRLRRLFLAWVLGLPATIAPWTAARAAPISSPLVPRARLLPAVSTTLVISQVYGGGGNLGAPYQNDYVELFNRGQSSVSLAGWSLQYASPSGSAWQALALPGVTVDPGQYFLAQLAGGANGLPLPASDVNGTLSLAAAAGKAALVSDTAALAGECPISSAIVDLVGYGADASCAETSAAPEASNSSAVLRAAGGCRDTDNNASDFEAGAPLPRNTAAALRLCQANLAVEMAGPALAPLGGEVAYHLSVRNLGEAIAAGVTLTHTLPAAVEFITYTASAPLTVTQPGPSAWAWLAGDLAPYSSALTLTVRGVVSPALSLGSWFTTTLAAATPLSETTLADNTAELGTLAGAPNLTLTKLGPAEAALGSPAVFTLTYANTGDLPLDAALVDDLPSEFDYLADSAGGLHVGGVITWALGTLSPGISGTVRLTATANAAGIFTNTAALSGSLPETDASDNLAAWPLSVAGPGDCGGPFLPIPAIQGTGAISPYLGQPVWTSGIVTGDYQGAARLNGYFLQAEAGDGDPATSDGLFVASNSPAVSLGDRLLISATVAETGDLTELAAVTAVTACGAGHSLAPVALSLPVPAPGGHERYEGMLVTVPQTLTVAQNYFLGQFGQVTLAAEGRLFAPTNGSHPGTTLEANTRRTLVLDDGSRIQDPDPIPYLGLENTLRAGDVVTGLTGLIDYAAVSSDSAVRFYRLHPTQPVTFTRTNPRAAAPPPVGGNVRVASVNLLNYFNGDGLGGGFPTARGADTLDEFLRQRAKLITAVAALDADVVGLMEVERDGAGSLSAIQDLVDGLNAATTAGAFAFVPEPAPGSEQVKVSLLYQPARVTPLGTAANYQVTNHPDYPNRLFDRPPLAQTFTHNVTGAVFTVIVNHFKAKIGCPASGPDADQGDGQGCWNAKRAAQAAALLDFVAERQAASRVPDVLVVGDLNAYGGEDPVLTLAGGGLVDQVARHVPAAERYSYVFDGLSGYLDHALATPGLDAHVAGAAFWHINADEPAVLDYNSEDRPPGLYAPDQFRASDHDPVLIGLALPAPASFAGSTKTADAAAVASGGMLTYMLTLVNTGQVTGTFWLTDTLDPRLTLVSAPGLSGLTTLTATGTLAPQAQQVFSLTVRVIPGQAGALANIAQLGGDGQTRQLEAPIVTIVAAPRRLFVPLIVRP